MKFILCLTLCSVMTIAKTAKILCVFTVPSISHQVVYRAVTDQLAKVGHELVIITPDPINETRENVTQIDTHDAMYAYMDTLIKGDHNAMTIRLTHEDTSVNNKRLFYDFSTILLSLPQVKYVIEDNKQKYDLLIIENLTPVLYGFAHKFKVPAIGISSLLSEQSSLGGLGNPTHPLLYTQMYSGALDNLSFWKRLKMFLRDLHWKYLEYQLEGENDALARKHFGDSVPSVRDMESNADLVLSNSHPLLSGIRPLVPAVVPLGSIHLRSTKPLPKNLQAYLDNSAQGVVYFSLGTNARSKDLPPELMAEVLGALRKLPQRVLWKFEDDQLPNLPPNVRIEKWLPQQDVLGHPNVKVFVTQGGQQSMEEAIYNGVPMVAIPLLGDQDLNAQRMEHLGIAVRLEIWDLTEDNFYAAINKVLNDESYKKNVYKVRDIVLDEPMKPLDRAVWWIEYVLRHKGAQHLRAPAAGMPLWEYFMLDVIGVLATALVLALSLICYIFKFLVRKIQAVTRTTSKKKLKNK